MAEGWTDAIMDEVSDLLLRAEAISLPGAAFFIALFAAGAEVDTGVWTNYARLSVTRNGTNFAAGSSGDSANLVLLDFGTADVTGGPQDVDEVRIMSASVAGTLCWQALLNTPMSIEDTDPVTIPIGDLDFSFSQT
jgi:hypothetical protein